MSINSTVVKLWTCTIVLNNGQTVETDIRAKTIKQAKELLKKDSLVTKIISIKKPKI